MKRGSGGLARPAGARRGSRDGPNPTARRGIEGDATRVVRERPAVVPSVLAELQRRRVFRTLIAYGVAAFG
ncbi:MAG: hypothetical protein ACJ784_11525, partial [Myxococcales bacterium]